MSGENHGMRPWWSSQLAWREREGGRDILSMFVFGGPRGGGGFSLGGREGWGWVVLLFSRTALDGLLWD